MRAQVMKIVLPVLLAIALCGAPSVFAAHHEAATVGDDQALHGVEAAHEANKAAEERKHGETAAAAHDEQLAKEHDAEVHEAAHDMAPHGDAHGDAHGAAHGEGHGDGHAAPMITAAKLKDLFWRTVNFLALVIILVKFLAKPIANGLAGRRAPW